MSELMALTGSSAMLLWQTKTFLIPQSEHFNYLKDPAISNHLDLGQLVPRLLGILEVPFCQVMTRTYMQKVCQWYGLPMAIPL